MTTLATWVGIDQRAPASIYIVSDSRLTLIGGGRSRVLTNEGRKVFACRDEPHIFGFWGQVAFPTRVLTEALLAIDDGKLFQDSHNAVTRQALFEEYVISRLEKQLRVASASNTVEFAILHATREGVGMASVFHLWILGWKPDEGWHIRERELPQQSEVLYAGGSGADAFLQRDASWKDSEIGRTSRGVFSAFVEALQEKYDELSGGAPQLAGLFRKGRPIEFGIVYENKRYWRGKRVALVDVPGDLEWFNRLFERTDPQTLKRIPEAQRHAAPSWLRPYKPRAS